MGKIAIAALAILLTACAKDYTANDRLKCEAFGHEPGSVHFANCMQARADARSRVNAAILSRPPVRYTDSYGYTRTPAVPFRQPYNCRTVRAGNVYRTQCF